MEYINFGKVVNVSTSVPTAIDDATYHIIIDFVPDDPNIFDDFHGNMDEILKHPDNYVLCNVGDITKTQDALLKLKDRVKELEGQLADAKKESDKKLCEVYMETNATLYSGAYSLIAIGKELEDLKKQAEYDHKKLEELKGKTVAEARYEWKPGCFTMIYTMCDGSKQTTGMDLAESIDATSISCGTIPKCKSCKNHRYYGKICGHMCHIPDSKCIIPNTFDIFPLTDEEAEGPACDKFEARKE